jgi:hypothetical protein
VSLLARRHPTRWRGPPPPAPSVPAAAPARTTRPDPAGDRGSHPGRARPVQPRNRQRSLAIGIRNDQQAVTNGLTLHWNSGRVEGTVNAKHMQSIAMFVRQMFVDAGLSEADVTVDSIVPGYYRRSKNWDVVATHKGHLVGVVELKSQASSPGNNANNRIEEAIGSAIDAKAVQELTGAFGNLGVWAAWSMTFNRDCESGKPIRREKGRLRFPLNDSAFDNMTYATQYATAVERFIAQKVYDAGWMLMTWVDSDGTIGYDEPIPTQRR